MAHRITLLAIVSVVCCLALCANAYTYSGGSGTAVDPYKIATSTNLITLGNIPADYDKHFILTADIDLTGRTFSQAVIAPDTSSVYDDFQGSGFSGVFDGNGHVIRNLTIANATDYAGLFGRSRGHIKNLRLEIANINGRHHIGGICGSNIGAIRHSYVTGSVEGLMRVGGLCGSNLNYGSISHCSSSAQVTGDFLSGGLCGENNYGIISQSFATGVVTGAYEAGGLCGYNFDGTISHSFATGKATVRYYCVGGLCGKNWNSTVAQCYATGAVSGVGEVGGLCGQNKSATISQSYAIGAVTCGLDCNGIIGGLCGLNSSGQVEKCFWNSETSGRSTSAGGTGKTTAEMKTQATFIDAGWDFVGESVNGTADVWRLCIGNISYPRLSWEFSVDGDLSCPDGVAMDDLLYLSTHWLIEAPDGTGPINILGPADTNSNGRVNLDDFAIIAPHWLTVSP